jgi:hypothetical protein
MTGGHHTFFQKVNWYDKADCEQLSWARKECPIPHSDFDGGMYVVTRYDDLRTVGEHPEVFSSSQPGVMSVGVPLPPLDLDPPLHRDFRAFLNRYFSRSFIDSNYRKAMEDIADELIDGFIDRGRSGWGSTVAWVSTSPACSSRSHSTGFSPGSRTYASLPGPRSAIPSGSPLERPRSYISCSTGSPSPLQRKDNDED